MAIEPDILQEDFTLLVPPPIPVAEVSNQDAAVANYTPILAGALALLVAAWLVMQWRRHFFRRKYAEAIEAIALRELTQWSTELPESEYRQAVAAVSGTVRRYVESRFGLNAPTLTTEEFWARQRLHRKIPADYDPYWTDFLASCDPIKYAGLHPPVHQFRNLLDSSVGFVKASSARRRAAA